ncbi:MAG: parvulin-like peptidyl-prolyl isomerase [Candidatus Latescibacterota bacterium]
MAGFRIIQKMIVLLGICGWVACGETQEGTTVAHVGQARLTKEKILSGIPTPFLSSISIEEKRQLVEKWVEEELLYQASLAQKLHEETEIVALVKQATRRLLVAELLERTYAKDVKVLEGEILNYFEANRQSFEREQPEIRVRHVLVNDKDMLNKVWDRLRDGELFEQVAREASVDVSAESGGDLGYFTEDMVSASFWEACQAAKLGRRTRITTKSGLHVIEVLDRREAGSERELVDVRGEIQQRILSERRQMLREKLLEEIKGRNEWSVDLDKVD